MNGIITFPKQVPESSTALSTRWGMTRSQQPAAQKSALHWTQPRWYPDLGLPASRLWEITPCCFMLPRLRYFVTGPNGVRQRSLGGYETVTKWQSQWIIDQCRVQELMDRAQAYGLGKVGDGPISAPKSYMAAPCFSSSTESMGYWDDS